MLHVWKNVTYVKYGKKGLQMLHLRKATFMKNKKLMCVKNEKQLLMLLYDLYVYTYLITFIYLYILYIL